MSTSSFKSVCRAQSDLTLDGAHPCAMPLDPTIAGMCTAAEMMGDPAPQRFVDVRLAAACAAVCLAVMAYAGRAYTAEPERASHVRHLAYSEGVVKPPKRATADDRARVEAERWGLSRKAVAR